MARADINNVYIVDDDPSVRKGLARVIRSAGFNAVTFASSESFFAGDYLVLNSCLIVDAKMPHGGGLDMLDRLQSEQVKIPVIVVTAHDDPETRTLASKAGAIGFFRKPVDADALLDAITWAMDGEKRGAS